ncbi:MAG: sensor histidine kinase, partial [Candidatus Methylomirabilales bacterium]
MARNRLRQELVDHFREKRELLRRQWIETMKTNGLLHGLTPPEIEHEFCSLYDASVSCLETGKEEAALAYARSMAQLDLFGKMTTERVIDGLLTLHEVYRRSLFRKYSADRDRLAKVLDTYAPMANRILTTVALAFVKERERAVKREIGQLRTLVKAGMILSAQLSLKAVLQRIVNMACKLVNARYGALGVLDGKGGLSQFITAGIDEKTRAAIGPLPVGKGILGVLIKEAKPLRLRDLTKDPRAHGFPPNHPPMRSFLGVPIISKGKILGNLYLTEKEGAEEFSEEDQILAMTLAAQAAIAIENASLYEELQRSYQELKRSQDLLLRQEKLASLGRLAAGLAHELNNPLNNIAGFLEALERRSQAEPLLHLREFEDFPPFLRIIHGEVDRAASIVRRLLDFARQREPSFELVDLGRLISETIALVERQASLANQRIIVEPLSKPVTLKADAQMLQQAFLNLLTNALDAIPHDHGQIAVRLMAHPEAAVIEVHDNGQGIAEEHRQRIF